MAVEQVQLTQAQREAAEAFVRAFGYSLTFGGGRQIVLRLPKANRWSSLDSWLGEDHGVAQLADGLAEAIVAEGAPRYSRPVAAAAMSEEQA